MAEIGRVVCPKRRSKQDVLDQTIDVLEVQRGHSSCRSCEYVLRHYKSALLNVNKFEDELRALLLLVSLPDSCETFKVTVCNSAPNGVVTWNLVKTRVLNEESRKVTKASSSSHSEVLVTQSRGEARAEVRVKGQKELGVNLEASMLIMSAIIAIRKGHIKWQCDK